MKKLLFIPLAASMALFSCKKDQKDQVKNIDGVVNQQQDNEYRVQNGKLEATISGKISEFSSKYAEDSYNFENKDFSFVNNNRINNYTKVADASGTTNYTSEQVVKWTDTSVDPYKDYEYTVKTFNIEMYENSGFNLNDPASDNKVSISFKLYSGDLTPQLEDAGYKTGSPQEISIGYSLDYSPEETIDYIQISENINSTTTFNQTTLENELEEKCSISGFEYDEATGKIKFDFKGDDSDNDRDPEIDGTVETEIFFNQIQNIQNNTQQQP